MEHFIEDEDDTYTPPDIIGVLVTAGIILAAGGMLYWGASAAFWPWTNAHG
jgi:hypothetical protein